MKALPSTPDLQVMRELLAEVRLLRRDLAARAPRAGDDPVAVEMLVLAIAATAGESFEWTCGELTDFAALPANADLRTAIDNAVGTRAGVEKRLGKLLRRHADAEVSGYRITRTRHDREGAHWKLVR